MIRKTIGTILAVLGAAMAIIIFTGGGPILPHILGPIILVTVGVVLFVVKGTARQSPEA
jgi:hypothetical protein